MPTVNKSALVPASAGEMYALVNDVEAYPRFLPWCGAARVHHQDNTRCRPPSRSARAG